MLLWSNLQSQPGVDPDLPLAAGALAAGVPPGAFSEYFQCLPNFH
jgi:hypothetical protein